MFVRPQATQELFETTAKEFDNTVAVVVKAQKEWLQVLIPVRQRYMFKLQALLVEHSFASRVSLPLLAHMMAVCAYNPGFVGRIDDARTRQDNR